MSDGDKATLKAERGPDGALQVTMRGDVYDGRSFVKIGAWPAALPGQEEPSDAVADLDLDLKLGAVAGFNGEALRGLDLEAVAARRPIKSFALNAKLGGDSPLIGDLRGRAGGRQVLYFETNDAGALFRFTDTYPRMYRRPDVGGDGPADRPIRRRRTACSTSATSRCAAKPRSTASPPARRAAREQRRRVLAHARRVHPLARQARRSATASCAAR